MAAGLLGGTPGLWSCWMSCPGLKVERRWCSPWSQPLVEHGGCEGATRLCSWLQGTIHIPFLTPKEEHKYSCLVPKKNPFDWNTWWQILKVWHILKSYLPSMWSLAWVYCTCLWLGNGLSSSYVFFTGPMCPHDSVLVVCTSQQEVSVSGLCWVFTQLMVQAVSIL